MVCLVKTMAYPAWQTGNSELFFDLNLIVKCEEFRACLNKTEKPFITFHHNGVKPFMDSHLYVYMADVLVLVKTLPTAKVPPRIAEKLRYLDNTAAHCGCCCPFYFAKSS
jgi:hypothetical protein